MFTSFSTALSALNADSTAIDVVGNDLANLNTPGYKATELCFSDLVTQSLGAGLGVTQVGFGVAQPITEAQYTQQGAIQTSGGLDDAAIQGDGFFVVANSAGNLQYTRAGDFQTDASGNLTTAHQVREAPRGQRIDGVVGSVVERLQGCGHPFGPDKIAVVFLRLGTVHHHVSGTQGFELRERVLSLMSGPEIAGGADAPGEIHRDTIAQRSEEHTSELQS